VSGWGWGCVATRTPELAHVEAARHAQAFGRGCKTHSTPHQTDTPSLTFLSISRHSSSDTKALGRPSTSSRAAPAAAPPPAARPDVLVTSDEACAAASGGAAAGMVHGMSHWCELRRSSNSARVAFTHRRRPRLALAPGGGVVGQLATAGICCWCVAAAAGVGGGGGDSCTPCCCCAAAPSALLRPLACRERRSSVCCAVVLRAS
jgi:hypothetical protein